METVKRITVNS